MGSEKINQLGIIDREKDIKAKFQTKALLSAKVTDTE